LGGWDGEGVAEGGLGYGDVAEEEGGDELAACAGEDEDDLGEEVGKLGGDALGEGGKGLGRLLTMSRIGITSVRRGDFACLATNTSELDHRAVAVLGGGDGIRIQNALEPFLICGDLTP
jgi:hypothetical protein